MNKLKILSVLIGSSLSASSLAIVPQIDPDNPNGYIVSRVQLNESRDLKTADPMYAIWAKALATRPNTIVKAIAPNLPGNPDNVLRAERIFPESEWNFLTAMAAPEYTYTRFLRAIGKFPAFCGEYADVTKDSDAICKKSIVTAFAHFAQETGGHIKTDNTSDNPNRLEEWQQALVHVREMSYSEGDAGYTIGCGETNWQTSRWPCVAGKGYFGRGAKQLSYHFNYGAFSEVMYNGDASVLLKDPGLVADSWLNMASAIWFFLTPQAPKPAMLHVIDRTWVPSQREVDAGIGYGFGTTINVINGGIECGSQNKTKGQPVNRIRYWEGLAAYYNIAIETDEENTCWQQTPFGSINLVGATDVLYTNWEADWKHYADRPEGKSFECTLVAYQTAYSALVSADYEKCVTNFHNSHAAWPQVRVVDTLPDVIVEPPVDGILGWIKNKVYQRTEQAAYKGGIYEAKWYSKDNEPSLLGPWKVIKSPPVQ